MPQIIGDLLKRRSNFTEAILDHVSADAKQGGVVEFQDLFFNLVHLFFQIVQLGFQESVVDARLVDLLFQVFIDTAKPLDLVVSLLLLPVAELFEGVKGALVAIDESCDQIDYLGRYAGSSSVPTKFERLRVGQLELLLSLLYQSIERLMGQVTLRDFSLKGSQRVQQLH